MQVRERRVLGVLRVTSPRACRATGEEDRQVPGASNWRASSLTSASTSTRPTRGATPHSTTPLVLAETPQTIPGTNGLRGTRPEIAELLCRLGAND